MNSDGASASRPGSREPRPEGLGPSGFDPSRVAILELSWREDGGLRIHSPTHPGMVLSHSRPDLVMLDVLPVLAELGFGSPCTNDSERRRILHMAAHAEAVAGNIAINTFPWVGDESGPARASAFWITARVLRARAHACDSDGSPEGGDACGSVHDSAGPKDIAKPTQPSSEDTPNG